MAANIEEIVEKLDSLTLLEASQLSKVLQEKWGVSAAAHQGLVRQRLGRIRADDPQQLDLTIGCSLEHLQGGASGL